MVLPASMRIKGYRCFNHLHRRGTRYHGESMVLRIAKPKPSLLNTVKTPKVVESCRFAVAISTKVSKKAVFRNRLRRIIHTHLKQRFSKNHQDSNVWCLLSLKPNSSSKDAEKLLEEFDELLYEAGLLS